MKCEVRLNDLTSGIATDEKASPRILVIEEEPEVAALLWLLLAEEGYDVRVVVNDEAAAGLWQSWVPETLVVDVADCLEAPDTTRVKRRLVVSDVTGMRLQ